MNPSFEYSRILDFIFVAIHSFNSKCESCFIDTIDILDLEKTGARQYNCIPIRNNY